MMINSISDGAKWELIRTALESEIFPNEIQACAITINDQPLYGYFHKKNGKFDGCIADIEGTTYAEGNQSDCAETLAWTLIRLLENSEKLNITHHATDEG